MKLKTFFLFLVEIFATAVCGSDTDSNHQSSLVTVQAVQISRTVGTIVNLL